MNTTRSADGTTIAYDRTGQGPALVLVDGALCSRAQGPMPELAEQLATDFTVYTYDRRGRNDSGDNAPYAVEREVEDLAAVIEAAGGSAYVYGSSSGAALALRGAAAGLPIDAVVAFETPFVVDDTRKPMPRDWGQRIAELDSAAAVKYFMTKVIGLPGILVTIMRLMPAWKGLKAVAHTLPYDAAIVGGNGSGKPLDPAQWATVRVPVAAVAGGKSPQWMRNAIRALAGAVPGAVHHELPGQNHIVKATAIAPVIREFLHSTSFQK